MVREGRVRYGMVGDRAVGGAIVVAVVMMTW